MRSSIHTIRRCAARLAFLVLLVLPWLAAPKTAQAYLDPGTGSILLQIIIGGVAGLGVVGKKAIHLQKVDEHKSASKIDQLWVDVGVGSRAEAEALGLRVGDAMVIDAAMVSLAGDRIASRAIDNRIGAYVVLEALRLLSDTSPMAGTTT